MTPTPRIREQGHGVVALEGVLGVEALLDPLHRELGLDAVPGQPKSAEGVEVGTGERDRGELGGLEALLQRLGKEKVGGVLRMLRKSL